MAVLAVVIYLPALANGYAMDDVPIAVHHPAADLARLDAIGVYPTGGWWKENKSLDRSDRQVPYALIVSIRAPGAAVDLYTPIAARLKATVDIDT